MRCIQTISFSVLINRSLYGHFGAEHGLREGDTLSPYMFILCGVCAIIRGIDQTD